MDAFVDEWLEYRWFGLVLLATFAGAALALAMLGVHSVLANLVAARTREIGIRMTLGAIRSDVVRLVVGQTAPAIVVGLAVGLVGSLGLGVLIRSMLFQVRPYDPVTLVLAAAALLAVTPLALWWPIRRATRLSCTVALREE
jgi:ABC-type antimicrobial peptide transport system permease subunit